MPTGKVAASVASSLEKMIRDNDQARDLLRRVIQSQYVPHNPTPKQAELLISEKLEVLYGGAAGGGKSDALLMAALAYVHESNYSALILRRSFSDLSLPGAVMDRAAAWLAHTDAKWAERAKTWTFPSGAKLSFGYLERKNDHFRYQGAELQMIAFDELTQFEEHQYTYLFSRLRRLGSQKLPVRMRAASNPGGIGHDWCKRRFIDIQHPDRIYIPARIQDNPYLDQEQYLTSLSHLDPITKRQLLEGDWSARRMGALFKREWFEILDMLPNHGFGVPVRYWDLAATQEGDDKTKNADYTVGCKMVRDVFGTFYVLDVIRERLNPSDVEYLVRQTAARDGRECRVRISQDPGASGKSVIDYYRRHVIPGYMFDGVRETGCKWVRAQPMSGQAGSRNIKLVAGEWIDRFLSELESFTEDGNHAFDDQVDASSGAFLVLAEEAGMAARPLRASVPAAKKMDGARELGPPEWLTGRFRPRLSVYQTGELSKKRSFYET